MPRNTIDWETDRPPRWGGARFAFLLHGACGGAAWPAQQLNVTQPAVPKAIGDLEHTFRVRLLDCRPQGVEPMMYGRALLKRGKVTFDELKQTVRDITVLADPTAGEISFGPRDNRGRNPPADHETIFPLISGRLDQRGIDFAIFRQSTPLAGQRTMDELHLEALFNDRLVVAAGRDWALYRHVGEIGHAPSCAQVHARAGS
jgi:DNA-binding transcriptional LysR family regulator